MNIFLVETFLQVVNSGNLSKAAKNLHVTQSTVTLRINTLEETIGQQLFIRQKSGSKLTPAGKKFIRYAELLIQTWKQASHQLNLPDDFVGLTNIGSERNLWDKIICPWLSWFRSNLPNIALTCRSESSTTLNEMMSQGLLDLCILYKPIPKENFITEFLFSEKLVLVSTYKRSREHWNPDYVFNYPGEDVEKKMLFSYAVSETPIVRFDDGEWALKYILENKGSGYFPIHQVKELIEKKVLYLVSNAPKFERPVYLYYSRLAKSQKEFEFSVEGLKKIVRKLN